MQGQVCGSSMQGQVCTVSEPPLAQRAMSMSDANVIIPSVWPARQFRRDAAIARDRAHVESRFQCLEASITSVEAKLDEILHRLGQSRLPPGLSCQESEDELQHNVLAASKQEPDEELSPLRCQLFTLHDEDECETENTVLFDPIFVNDPWKPKDSWQPLVARAERANAEALYMW